MSVEVIKSATFDRWLENLVDARAKARILIRIDRLQLGNAGDVKPIGEGLSEMRLDYGPGYRIYYLRRGAALVVLLCGGGKSTQAKDIDEAKRLAGIWRETMK